MNITWLEPWGPLLRPEHRAALEAELSRELSAAHPLFGLHFVALAQRQDQDDVLFQLDDGRVAEVHLTWRGRREDDARWPRVNICSSVDNWAEDRMQLHHQEFNLTL